MVKKSKRKGLPPPRRRGEGANGDGNGQGPVVAVPVDPRERLLQLLMIRRGLPEGKWRLLAEKMAELALDEGSKPGVAIEAVLAVVEIEKVDLAAAKLVMESALQGQANAEAERARTTQVSRQDAALGLARLLACADEGEVGEDRSEQANGARSPLVGSLEDDDAA